MGALILSSQFSKQRWQYIQQRLKDFSHPLHVVGLGAFGGNLTLIQWLCELGHAVVIWEKKGPEDLADSLKNLNKYSPKLTFHWHAEPQLPQDDLIFVTPAMAPSSEALRGIDPYNLSTEIECALALAAQKECVVHAVTGSVGKSTSASLLAKALNCEVFGNIGRSLLAESDPWPKEIVLEVSSYQLHYLRRGQWCPSSGLMTPLRDHHAAWHGSVEAYRNCKLEAMEAWAKNVPCTTAEELSSEFLGLAKSLADQRTWKLLGEHNLNNIVAAIVHLLKLNKSSEASLDRMAEFSGLSHRLELCAQVGNYRCINDSKATSPSAVIQALRSVASPCILILQGVPTGDPREMLALAQAQCSRIIMIGGMGVISQQVTWPKQQPEVYKNLDHFFENLGPKLEADLLFSPGGPSYDQYLNYEKRGEHFRRLCLKSLEIS
jgi:UDP-N-acetylmuramoylalanine--D-glutamate ligase